MPSSPHHYSLTHLPHRPRHTTEYSPTNLPAVSDQLVPRHWRASLVGIQFLLAGSQPQLTARLHSAPALVRPCAPRCWSCRRPPHADVVRAPQRLGSITEDITLQAATKSRRRVLVPMLERTARSGVRAAVPPKRREQKFRGEQKILGHASSASTKERNHASPARLPEPPRRDRLRRNGRLHPGRVRPKALRRGGVRRGRLAALRVPGAGPGRVCVPARSVLDGLASGTRGLRADGACA